MNAVHPLPSRNDRAHGDDGQRPYSEAEQVSILNRRDELVAERMRDPSRIVSLLEGVEISEINRQLARALSEIDKAAKGDSIATFAVLASVSQIQMILKPEAREVWNEECELEAEAELDE